MFTRTVRCKRGTRRFRGDRTGAHGELFLSKRPVRFREFASADIRVLP